MRRFLISTCAFFSIFANGLAFADQARQIYNPPAALVKKAQQSVAAKAKDPASVQFRNIVAKGPSPDPKKWVICGEVNAKNGFGGYAGFTRFAYDESINDSWIDTEEAPNVMVRTLCGSA